MFDQQASQPKPTSARGTQSRFLDPADDNAVFTTQGTSVLGLPRIIWNFRSTQVPDLTLTANSYLDADTDPTFFNTMQGEFLALHIKQDSVGGRTLSWSPAFIWDNNLEPNLPTDPDARTILQFYCSSLSLYGKVFYQTPTGDSLLPQSP